MITSTSISQAPTNLSRNSSMTLPLRESRLEPSIRFPRKVDVSRRRRQTFSLLNFMESAVQGSQADGREVIAGLSSEPKTLPTKYFYDERGSLLFDQICHLLEYYPARTESAILQQFASAISHITGPCAITELGSGSATKTRLLLDAYQSAGYAMHYTPIDVSKTVLIASSTQLLVDYPTLSIQGVVSTFEPALARLSSLPLPASLSKRLLCFFGSTIGNLSPSACSALLSQISTVLQAGDYFLIGIDLQKDISILETAYNDSQGITAAFNLNLLDHLNQRWQGDFDTHHFSHVAFYNPEKCQIEMHLESLIAQSVRLKSLNHAVHFAAGDRLLTEISRKFEMPSFRKILHDHNLPVSQVFVDSNGWYALLLCQYVA